MLKLIRLINTIKYLKFKQLYYRLFYALRKKVITKRYNNKLNKEVKSIVWLDYLFNYKSFLGNNNFSFLNVEHHFGKSINWNYSKYGKLWTFNLNYFDFLNQEKITINQGEELIQSYIKKDNTLLEGKESYTISLRGINWIKFLSKHQIKNSEINQVLFNHYQRLIDNLELQFLGNHYLENGFSLLFAAYYFQHESFYKQSKKILKEQLEAQILNDGGHFELSPMYHQTMLHRVLDCINLITSNDVYYDEEFSLFLKNKAELMLAWLKNVTYKNGNIPMVNDSTFGIALSSSELFNYASFLDLNIEKKELSDSGYRKISKNNYELFLDVGEVGASYIPAHAQSDTFSFELQINGNPFIVDPGISTYEKNKIRNQQRSTFYHNTVVVNNKEQTDVWGGFRVGKRAFPKLIIETKNQIIAEHNGYNHLGVTHKRLFNFGDKIIEIKDEVIGKKTFKSEAHLHFHPSLDTIKVEDKEMTISALRISFGGKVNYIDIKNYDYCLGFNKTTNAQKAIIGFEHELTTNIDLLI